MPDNISNSGAVYQLKTLRGNQFQKPENLTCCQRNFGPHFFSLRQFNDK